MSLRRLVIAAALLLGSASAQERPSDTLEALAQVSRNIPEQTRAGLVREKYRYLFPSRDLASLNSDDLRARFDAAEIAAFYSYDSEIVKEQQELLTLLRQRGLATPSDFRATVGSLVLVRELQKADALQKEFADPSLAPIPRVIQLGELDPAKPSVLSIRGDQLVRYAPNLSGTHVLVVAHPLCHFSQNASKAIEDDNELAGKLAKLATWIVPPERSLNLSPFADWNSKHPTQQMVLAYSVAEWRQIPTWSTPTFYFFRDGKLIRQIVGWPKDGSNLEPLRKAVEELNSASSETNLE